MVYFLPSCLPAKYNLLVKSKGCKQLDAIKVKNQHIPKVEENLEEKVDYMYQTQQKEIGRQERTNRLLFLQGVFHGILATREISSCYTEKSFVCKQVWGQSLRLLRTISQDIICSIITFNPLYTKYLSNTTWERVAQKKRNKSSSLKKSGEGMREQKTRRLWQNRNSELMILEKELTQQLTRSNL